MTIEELTNTQLLLLTILVNFIVSIATGVLVISMLDQSPTPITQTVQQIVDTTIETVTAPIANPGTVKPVPAAPSGEDQLKAAIASDSARTVLIHRGSTTTPAIAFGVYLSKSRAVATAAVAQLPKEAIIQFADGTSAPASLSKQGATVAIYGFSDTAVLPDAPAANPVAATSLAQGQTVVALTKDSAAITGIISKVDASGITTTLTGVPAGAGVVDLSGSLIGIGSASGILLPTDRIMVLLESPPAS